jgi:hypothetical protein
MFTANQSLKNNFKSTVSYSNHDNQLLSAKRRFNPFLTDESKPSILYCILEMPVSPFSVQQQLYLLGSCDEKNHSQIVDWFWPRFWISRR